VARGAQPSTQEPNHSLQPDRLDTVVRDGDAFLGAGDGSDPRAVNVVGAGGEVASGGPKERCLLTVLTLYAGAVVAEDRLVDVVDGSASGPWLGGAAPSGEPASQGITDVRR
jgi:hypothetical protein